MAMSLIVGSFVWYKSRPPKPWNSTAIKAQLAHIEMDEWVDAVRKVWSDQIKNEIVEEWAKLEAQNTCPHCGQREHSDDDVMRSSERRDHDDDVLPF